MLAQAATTPDKAAALRTGLFLLAPFAAAGLAVYVRWAARVKAQGGRVSTERFGLPDLIVTLLLAGLFMTAAYLQFTAPKPPAFSVQMLIQSTQLEVWLIVLLVGFLLLRKIRVLHFLGLRLYPPAKLIGRAALFLLCAYPIVALANLLLSGSPDKPEEQHIVSYFREQASLGQFRGIAAVCLTAVVVAPIFEELFFRGYFYPALKRYVGPVAGSIIVSALFACIHATVNVLPALFILAMCLTLAYEWSGSIFVPMTMHAAFNSINLLLLYATSGQAPPAPLTP
jgi:membrane protease YdiL (CAAX protease family)